MTLPRIGITLGDPGGVGPEIVFKAFAGDYELPAAGYVIFSSGPVLRAEEKALGVHFDFNSEKTKKTGRPGTLTWRELPSSLKTVTKGSPSAKNGRESFRYFKGAVAEAREGKLDAVVTAPISKSSWALAGVPWKGHTDYLSQFYAGAIMAFWSEELKIALLSHHVSLKAALKKVRRESLLDFFISLHRSVKGARTGGFEFLVAGLNPHAGEDGLLGREEIEEVAPAVKEARRHGLKISGPYPPDVVFRRALGRKDKMVVALYHDQGLIPFKLAAFETGVNVSLGLPFVRTSPDHGTAFDIAGKNRADPRSLVEAIKLAAAFSRPA
ncbi:MAG: pdxA [Candidatus Aminicenantes bacterium]|jgi:4-hydroxythreonine-4-phosphate dehydrogenase|nr:pdxA [Candidatus Aminicenantes bacterium]